MEWTDDFIRVWSWPKRSAPGDVLGADPNPSSWGKPAQLFDGANANIKDRFGAQKMIFDTTFCGDWAGNTWADDGCVAQTGFNTCKEYVAYRGSDFDQSYWELNAVKIYQKKAGSVTATTSSKSSTTSSRAITTSSSVVTSSVSTSTTTSYHFGNGTTTSHGFTTSSEATTSKTSESSSTTKNGASTTKPDVTGGYSGWPNAGAPVRPTGWSNWEPVEAPTYTTTTITKTYVVPCETGMKTETVTITTKFVIGGKPYTPAVPSSTYVTSLPAEWGFGGPITVTVPMTETRTVVVGGGSKPTDANTADPSWSAWSSTGIAQRPSSTKGSDPSSTWAAWNSASTSQVADPASTWAAWSATASSTSVKGVAQATGAAAWDAWNATSSGAGVQGVKVYTGAASKTMATGLLSAALAGVAAVFLL